MLVPALSWSRCGAVRGPVPVNNYIKRNGIVNKIKRGGRWSRDDKDMTKLKRPESLPPAARTHTILAGGRG